MPSEEIEITLTEDDPYWSGALYMATLAYPDPLDRAERDNYQHAIIRWTLDQRMKMDPDWAKELQVIRPAYFSGPDKWHDSVLKRGTKRLDRHNLIAYYVVLPHLRSFDTGREHKVEGFTPDFDNMITRATAKLGLATTSVSTVAGRGWRDVKPVAHAMCAYFVWSQILWIMWGRKPEVDRRMTFLILPEYVEEVAEIAEHFREQIPQIDAFEIGEEQTIRIVTRWV